MKPGKPSHMETQEGNVLGRREWRCTLAEVGTNVIFFFSKDCSKVLNSGVLSKLGGYFEIKSQR